MKKIALVLALLILPQISVAQSLNTRGLFGDKWPDPIAGGAWAGMISYESTTCTKKQNTKINTRIGMPLVLVFFPASGGYVSAEGKKYKKSNGMYCNKKTSTGLFKSSSSQRADIQFPTGIQLPEIQFPTAKKGTTETETCVKRSGKRLRVTVTTKTPSTTNSCEIVAGGYLRR